MLSYYLIAPISRVPGLTVPNQDRRSSESPDTANYPKTMANGASAAENGHGDTGMTMRMHDQPTPNFAQMKVDGVSNGVTSHSESYRETRSIQRKQYPKPETEDPA